MERINRKGRAEALRDGDSVVVYVPSAGPAPASGAAVATNGSTSPNGPLPVPPLPALLP